jgi:hypothetical protein
MDGEAISGPRERGETRRHLYRRDIQVTIIETIEDLTEDIPRPTLHFLQALGQLLWSARGGLVAHLCHTKAGRVHFSTRSYLIAVVRLTERLVSARGGVVAVCLQLRAMSRVTDLTGDCNLQIAARLGVAPLSVLVSDGSRKH